MIDILNRIIELRKEKGWSEYKLSVESGIPQSTISSWFRKNAQPSLLSIEAICNAFGITMSQFFTESDSSIIELTDTQINLLSQFSHLSKEQQNSLIDFLSTFDHQNNL